jgi:acetylornithine deacetylase
VVAAVVDEEHMSLGAEALVAEWSADAAVVAEPTDLQVAIAHKGFEWVEIETRGRAAHGSAPADGRDAILRMGRVLIALESLDRRLQSKAPHPLLGSPSLHASVIAGGGELSSYPDRCTLRVERRTLPGESGQAGLTEARVILERLREDDCDFQGHASHVFSRPAYEIAPSHPLPGMLQVAAESAGRSVVATGMPYWTDAAILGGAGVPTVLFGPGGSGLHGPDEHVKVDEVIECRNALVAFARLYLRG